MLFTLIIGFVIGAATIVFALQNTGVVSLSFLSWQFASPLALVIILTAAVGALLGILASFPSLIHKSLAVRRLRKENQGLRDEADTLRKWNEDTVAHYEAQIESKAPDAF